MYSFIQKQNIQKRGKIQYAFKWRSISKETRVKTLLISETEIEYDKKNHLNKIMWTISFFLIEECRFTFKF